LLAKLNVPAVRAFEDKLKEEGRSAVMVRKVIGSLGSLIADAQERGLVARNIVRDLRGRRKPGKERKAERRQKGKLKAGIDIPLPTEIKAIVTAVQGRWRPLLLTAIFAGLRASEIRGLRWDDVDLDGAKIHVRQRADRFNDIGRPKSEAGERTVPVPPLVANTLREWKLACPKGTLGLVFPNGAGNVESLGNIINRGLCPPQVAAGVVIDTGQVDDKGNPVMAARYSGMHSLRHFYASWCINRRADGGLELPAKVVQERLGHSSIVMTMDTYGHLFPSGDDAAELASAERALLG
jgi:integrase